MDEDLHEAGKPKPILEAVLACMGLTAASCAVMPLALGSNIWPIAAVFWGVLVLPLAALVGLGLGVATRGLPDVARRPVVIAVAVAVASIVAAVIAATP